MMAAGFAAGTLMEISCLWGRSVETQRLLDGVTARSSATLVRGDPQIGKSALLAEFVRKLRDADDRYRIGAYKAIATPHDPFTFVVADLLKDVYSWSHLGDQASIIATQLKRTFTMAKFKEVCFALWKTISALPGVPPIDPLVQWLKTEMEGLDLSAAQHTLSTHEVTAVLKTLLQACPELRVVLIVDDYSAAYEGRPIGAPPAWDHGTLLHLLAERLPNVHILIAWKDSFATAEPLEQLTQCFLQHSGTTVRLLPLDPEATLQWARSDLPQLLTNAGDMMVLRLAEGLPKVLAELKASAITDARSAVVVAEQIKRGSYEFLHTYLSACDTTQCTVLMQMAANEIPTPAWAMAAILSLSEEDIIHASKLAQARDLLVELVPGLFVFEHDVKRRVVTEHLHRFHAVRPYFERALQYHESQLEDLSPLVPIAVFHVFAALHAAAGLSAGDERAPVRDFYSLYIRWLAQPRDRQLITALVAHRARERRPGPMQAVLLRDAVSFAYPELAPAVEEASVQRTPLPAPEDVVPWFVAALANLPVAPDARGFIVHASKFATAHAAFDRNEAALAAFDQSLDAVMWNDDEEPAIVADAAIALANTTVGNCPGRRGVAGRLRVVGERREWSSDLILTYTRALVNLIKAEDADEFWVLACVNDVLAIAERDDLSEETAEACLRGLHDAAVSLDGWQRRGQILHIVEAASTLAGRYGNFTSVVALHAKVLYNATAYFGRMSDRAKVLWTFDSLQALVATHTGTDLLPELIAACANVMVLALETSEPNLTQRMEGIADTLPGESLARSEVRQSYAVIVSSAAISHRNTGAVDLMIRSIDKLESLTQQFSDPQAAKYYGSALWRIMSDLNDAKSPDYDYAAALDLFRRLSSLRARYGGDRDVVLECSIGIANFANLAGLRRDWPTLHTVVKQLETAARPYASDADVATHVGRGLGAAWFLSSITGDNEIADECEQASVELGPLVLQATRSFQAKARELKERP